MPDHRAHRGPHPEDDDLFAESSLPALRDAVQDLAWHLNRGYAPVSSIKLVGDRYALQQRQRTAVTRCTCSDAARDFRASHRMALPDLFGQELELDGYNVLTSIEAALGGGVILFCRDGCYRDMASMHGTYRKVEETLPAIQLAGELLQVSGVQHCRWLLDSPVSNSGRLKTMLLEAASTAGWNWTVELVPDPDRILAGSERIVATADSVILDAGPRWCNFARELIQQQIPAAHVIDLSDA